MNVNIKKSKGIILINVLVFAMITVVILTAFVSWAGILLKSSRQLKSREQAFAIAEAGVDYYRWHLAHAPTDYKDGNPSAPNNGPFTHDFVDKDGNVIGQYNITITPPKSGSTVVKVKSTGVLASDPSASRTIESTLAIPSFAKYAVVANNYMRFGQGTEVFGPIHSNAGIRFDGLAHNLVTSAVDKFVDVHNGSSQRYGVYTTISPTDPSPPAPVPNRTDVFMTGRKFPVPSVDFSGLTTDLSKMKSDAQADGKYFASSGAQGYHIVLKSNNTFDLYKVTALTTVNSSCSNVTQGQAGWGTWSIRREVNPVTGVVNSPRNYPFPANGIIFFEDHVWVDGHIDGARLTIAAGRFPDSESQRRNIIINKDLTYTYYNGDDVIALVAQGDINTGLSSEDDLRVDGALIAQNGRIGRYYYASACGTGYKRDSITLLGMLGTNRQYGFAWTDGTGYEIRNISYDSNLLYAPPPSFPLTSDQYTTISWEEIK